MTVRQREPRIHDEQHLAFVRRQPCCCGCGRPGPSDAAHIRMACPEIGKRSTGMQEKPSDRYTVPLNHWCHQDAPDAQHKGSEAAFWQRKRVNPFDVADRMWLASGAAGRHGAVLGAHRKRKPSRPRPKPQKIKRAWPSRPFPQGRGFGQ